MLTMIANWISRLKQDCSGNFALMTAILAMPLMITVGMAIDFARAYDVKSILDQYADAASVAAINSTSKAYANQFTTSADWNREAEKFFRGNLNNYAFPITISPVVARNGNIITAQISYSTTIPTYFLQLAGLKTLTIVGNTSAEFKVGDYYNISVLVDNSPSMGIGASTADVAKLQDVGGCAFACHVTSAGSDSWDNMWAVRASGATLRIDVVRKALQQLANLIQTQITQKSLYKLSLFSLGATGESALARPLTQLQAPTNDMTAFSKSADGVQLMSVPTNDFNRWADTDLMKSLQLISIAIPDPGNGASSLAPRQVLMLITDGVADFNPLSGPCYGVRGSNRCLEYIDVNSCKALKDRGIIIAVLHTTYLRVTGNSNYDDEVAPYAGSIGPALQSCASPNLYQAVDLNSDISKGLNDLFARATNMPRLTM